MYIYTETGMIAGPHDALSIVRDTSTGRFHVFVWEEHPFPFSDQPRAVTRLQSKLHHTAGAETFEGALEHLVDIRKKIVIRDENVYSTIDKMLEWDFTKQGFTGTMLIPVPLAQAGI